MLLAACSYNNKQIENMNYKARNATIDLTILLNTYE